MLISKHATAAEPRAKRSERTRPFLKWAGGKTQLVDTILEHFPKQYRRYHEPFVGGGAMFFALEPSRASLSDINEQLVLTYTAIRDDVDAVIAALTRLEPTRENFYRVRALDPIALKPVQAAARLLFLNRTCFNGLYRVNRRGQFNVPFGRYARTKLCLDERLRSASRALRGVTLRAQPIDQLSRQVRRGDLVYFDPPYVPLTKTANFMAYARGGFDSSAHEKLAQLFRRLDQRGVSCVLSNADTPWVRRLYAGFRIQRVAARRAINCHSHKRGVVNEVIVSNT